MFGFIKFRKWYNRCRSFLQEEVGTEFSEALVFTTAYEKMLYSLYKVADAPPETAVIAAAHSYLVSHLKGEPFEIWIKATAENTELLLSTVIQICTYEDIANHYEDHAELREAFVAFLKKQGVEVPT